MSFKAAKKGGGSNMSKPVSVQIRVKQLGKESEFFPFEGCCDKTSNATGIKLHFLMTELLH